MKIYLVQIEDTTNFNMILILSVYADSFSRGHEISEVFWRPFVPKQT